MPLGWTVSGPIPISELRYSAACHTAYDDDVKLAEVVTKRWDMESCGTTIVTDRQAEKDKLASEIQNPTIQFNGDQYSETINSDLKKGYVSILSKDELAATEKRQVGTFLVILSLVLIYRTKLDECVTQPVNFVVIRSKTYS